VGARLQGRGHRTLRGRVRARRREDTTLLGMSQVPSRADARALARGWLEDLGNRWHHTEAVAARAEMLAHAVEREDRELLVVAAWLHDLGYAPGLVSTGFHPVDGARFLEAQGYPVRLCARCTPFSGHLGGGGARSSRRVG
jgi:putative nucleotidyltransferase with HDIG domain